jgi:hypothetical protein
VANNYLMFTSVISPQISIKTVDERTNYMDAMKSTKNDLTDYPAVEQLLFEIPADKLD